MAKPPNAKQIRLASARLELFDDARENELKLVCFLSQAVPDGSLSLYADQSQPKLAFFGFLAADPKLHHAIFITQRLIRLDAIGGHGSRRPDQLLGILEIGNRARQPTHQLSNVRGKFSASLF